MSQNRDAVSVKKPTKEEAEEVTTVDQKQFTPENDIHKEEMNLKDEICMKGENSLTTKETKEVFENEDTTKQKHLNQKDREKTADLRKDDLKTYHF